MNEETVSARTKRKFPCTNKHTHRSKKGKRKETKRHTHTHTQNTTIIVEGNTLVNSLVQMLGIRIIIVNQPIPNKSDPLPPNDPQNELPDGWERTPRAFSPQNEMDLSHIYIPNAPFLYARKYPNLPQQLRILSYQEARETRPPSTSSRNQLLS